MAEKTFKKVSQLKEGSYILIDGAVCRIKSIEKSKPGRHGAAKARIAGVGLFDRQKRTLLKPTSAEVDVPIINRNNAQVVAVVGDQLQIMDLKTYEMFSVKKPADLSDLASGVELEYVKYGDLASVLRKRQG